MLQFMGSQRVGDNCAPELNLTELNPYNNPIEWELSLFPF